MKKNKKYGYKNVDMLITARTVVKNFEGHKAELVALRSNWADPFIGDLKTRVNYALSHYIGQNTTKDLKLATQSINQLQEIALRDLGVLKLQLDVDYAADKIRQQWLLATLGFNDNYIAAKKGDQEALIALLYSYNENMDPIIQAELVAGGIQDSLLESIKTYADPLREVNVDQENLKGISKELTAEAVEAFNTIYSDIMAVCRISAKLLADNPAVKAKFTFSTVAKKLNHKKGIEKPDIRRNLNGIESQVIDPTLRDDLNPDSPPVS